MLNTVEGLPMMALGLTTLHLRIANFKFTHNFIICDRLPETEIMFGIDVQKKFFYHMLGIKRRNATYRRMADFSHIPETAKER